MHPLSYGSIFGNLQQCKTFSTYDKDCEKVIKFCQSGEISPYLVTFLLKDASFSIPDLYAQPHPMPATSPHQVSKISAAAYSTYAPPPQVHHTGVATHQVTSAPACRQPTTSGSARSKDTDDRSADLRRRVLSCSAVFDSQLRSPGLGHDRGAWASAGCHVHSTISAGISSIPKILKKTFLT